MISPSIALRSAVALAVAAASLRAQPATTQAADPKPLAAAADPKFAAATAERFALAADALSGDAASVNSLRAAAALLDLARRQRPDEIRFARAAADVLLRLGDRDRAVKALNAVRLIDPKDQLAMIQFVDLTIAGLETADARQAYAQQIVDAERVPMEVRSHAAVQLMNAQFQRGQDAAAIETLRKAIFLNPQNATALETNYRLVASTGKAVDRATALLRLIEVAPNDPRHLISMAQECVAAGDYDAAAGCYQIGFAIVAAERQGLPPLDDVADCVAALLLAGKTDDAQGLLSQVTQASPSDGRLYSLALLASQTAAPDADLKTRIADARGVYLAQLAGVSGLVRNPASTDWPATRPAVAMPDVVADANALAADDSRQLSTAYAVSLSELIWFDLSFRAATVDDATIGALRTLVGADAPIVTRFEGWRLLNAGSVEEARVKFNAVADRDGFAKLGLAAAAVAQNDEATAKKLLSEVLATRPTGLFGAQVAAAAARLGVKSSVGDVLVDVSQTAGRARDVALAAIGKSRDLYLLTAEPSAVSYAFGEAMIAKLTILNVGPRPVAIGPRGLIRPTFAIDVATRGEGARPFPATVVGKWAGAVRLPLRQSTSQTVRLDRGPLDAFLRQYPTPLINMSAYVTTNPVPGQRGTTTAAAGQQATLGSVIERRSSPLYVEAFRTKLAEQLKNGAPADRVGAAELIAAVLPELAKQQDNAGVAAVRQQLDEALTAQAAADTDAGARAWINAFVARDDASALERVAREMGPDGAAAALTRAALMPKATRESIAKAAGATDDPAIGELAQALASLPDAPAATQP